MPKPGSKPIPRPIAAADGDSLAGSIQQAQSDHAASHGGKSLPTPNLAHGGHVPAPNAPVPRPQSDGWGAGGQKGGVQRANGAAAFGYGFGQGGVNATADAMGDLSVGQKGGGGVGMDGGLGLQFGNFGTGAGGVGGDFGFGFAGTAGSGPDASQRDAQQPANPYGNVYGQPASHQPPTSAKQADSQVKLPDDLSKDGASPSGGGGSKGAMGAGAMPAGGVPPYAAPYGAMGAYNYMMPPQMAVQVGAEAYGAAYGAYGAAAAGNGYGGDGGDYYKRSSAGAASDAAASVAGASQPGGDGRAGTQQGGPAVGSGVASGSNAPGNAPSGATGQSSGAASAGAGAMAGAFSAMPGMGATGYPYMGYPYMTPGMPPAAGYAVQSPYYGYPQANMYAAANAYGQQSGSSGAGGGKGGKGGYGGYGGGGQRSNYSQPPAPPAPPSSGNGNDSSQFNYYGNYGQSAYGR